MKKIKGFTLIELLVVIGILTILAGIAIPNYLHAQVRAKVARAHADMRSLAGALESYKVDWNSYPVSCRNGINPSSQKDVPVPPFEILTNAETRLGEPDGNGNLFPLQKDSNGTDITCYLNCNDAVIMATWPKRAVPPSWRTTFSVDPGFKSLTTPVAYISSYPRDPFADTQGLVYGYTNMENLGWVVWSFGPDCDEKEGGEIGEAETKKRGGLVRLYPTLAMNWPGIVVMWELENMKIVRWTWRYATQGDDQTFPLLSYHPELCSTTTRLQVCGFTYDPTNGINSEGDVWRIKQ